MATGPQQLQGKLQVMGELGAERAGDSLGDPLLLTTSQCAHISNGGQGKQSAGNSTELSKGKHSAHLHT